MFRNNDDIINKITEDIINKITEDIINISYSKGGDYSDEVIHCFVETYME